MEGNFGAPPQHRNHLKSPVGNQAGHRRRQQAVQIGKERREAVVRAKRLRRGDAVPNGDQSEAPDSHMDEEATARAAEASSRALEENTLKAVKALREYVGPGIILGKDMALKKIEALRNVRSLLSCNAMPPLNVAVEAGVVPLLVQCLAFGSPEEQILEAAWCLTNIASGEQDLTKAVLPALPYLISHLGDKSAATVAEQCAWAIGNVAGEGEEMRDILLAQGAMRPLARLMSSPYPSLARTASWAMSNLIKGPSPRAASDLMKIEGMADTLVGLMMKGDEELMVELAWVMVYLTSMADAHSGILLSVGLLPILINKLGTSDQTALLTPFLRCIGNIVAGDNSKTDAVLNAGGDISGGIIGALTRCLDMGHRTMQKEAAWAVSNIAAGSMLHKRMVFQGGAIPSLLHLLATAAFDVRKEAAYALGNVCVAPKAKAKEVDPIVEHLTVLVDRGCIPGFTALVKSPDMEAARLGLQFLELVMRGLPGGQGPKVVEKEDGIAAMETLQFHENDELRLMANTLIDKYFGEDYGLEEEYGSEVVDMIRGSDESSEYPPWRRGVVNG
ncbi:hypothetical protein MPTK1_6g06520 [Marchantia polymorpha subsp. ruderalis]|uniref:Importin subunit alpha n=2 Tax=Marchantia polymorpha TaxID=3197 RepID=A0A176WBE4_MARPO|nr:hypothetical protein AXG93_3902s1070 [Marchantia polymorpha subsp. ruderalis]PTQ27074.1 hypothetical protein MARPO_0226s0004 [Marchantia polymorpha]BBN13805.1 hypothetical protein Mp_6g06520 [Marchantia polymorpha subsp. ruderalis]|eukprot:PTQ27074.1 hypothetical protein MARPO_0226s0004 [Marchantia polymorpha]